MGPAGPGRVLTGHREERLEVERDRPQHVRSTPARHELQIPVRQPITDPARPLT
jgi:hypothetical protein